MAFEINLESPGLDKLLDKVLGVASGIGKVRDQVKGLGQDADQARAKGSESFRSRQDAAGPYQQREALRAQYEAATSGVFALRGAKLDDFKYRLAQSEARVNRFEKKNTPKTSEERLHDLLYTSRMGPDGSLYPLVGKMAMANMMMGGVSRGTANFATGFAGMGIEAMAPALLPLITSLAVPAALAVGGALTVYQGIKSTVAEMGDKSQAYYRGGGTPRETSELGAIATMMGLKASDLAQKAEQFGDKLYQGGGIGAAYFRAKGLRDLGFYTPDKAGNYLQGIELLRNKNLTDQQALQIARDSGMQDELRFRDLSEPTWRSLKHSMAGMASPAARKDQEEYEANSAIFWNTYERARRGVLGPLVRATNDAFGTFTGSTFDKAWAEAYERSDKGKKEKAASQQSRQAATKTIGDLTDKTRASRSEMIGGEGKAERAIPGAWKYVAMDEALQGQANTLGWIV